jgi:HAD superfamily hydrolase (TIGR01490 family)
MQKAAFFDVDYTLYNGYLGSNLTRFLTEKGYADKRVAEEEVELQRQFNLGEIGYRQAAQWAIQLNADALRGRTPDEAAAWLGEFIEMHNYIYPWAAGLMDILRQKGYEVYLISAALTISVATVGRELGVKHFLGSELAQQNGRYTGEIARILNFEEKHMVVQQLLAQTKYEKHVGFGDSMGDVDMLGVMDKAVVYNPKSQDLVSLAHERGWFIANAENILSYARQSL